jgi:predicted Na+-dependent transporter
VEEIPEYINLLSYLFIVVYMLSVPLETSIGEILQTLGNLKLMGRALLANFVIIPILGIFIAGFFDLPADIRTGFLLLAMAPGGLLALQFARVSKGNRVLAVALLFGFCLLAILITPALVLLFFPREGAGNLPFGWLILTLLLLIVLPAFAGRALQMLIPQHAPKLGLWLGRLSIVLFMIAAVMAGRYKSPAIKLMGTNGITAIVLLIIGAWIVGWLLGGPEIRNRKVLAISSSMRNVGVCLPLASGYFAGTDVFVPMLAFSGIMIPMNMVFALVTSRALHDPAEGVGSIKTIIMLGILALIAVIYRQ